MATANPAELTPDLDFRTWFTAKQHLANEAADSHKYTLFGGSRGPGKSRWLRQYSVRFLILCWMSGLNNVMTGLFCENYPTLKDRQISKIGIEFPRWLGELSERKDRGLGFHLKEEYGGGSILLRNLDDPDKYQSAEFALIAVDELTKNMVDVFNSLRGSMRWPGIDRPRFIAASNPGSIGHHWVRSYWGIQMPQTLPQELLSLAHEFAFVPGLPDDNPFLSDSYWEELNSLPPILAKAWRWGRWDVFKGQAFPQWNEALHAIEPFDLPEYFPMWRSMDWGFNKPWACLTLARDPDIGRVYVVGELYKVGLTDRQQAQMIVDTTPFQWSDRIKLNYADPKSYWTKKSYQNKVFTPADEYRSAGIVLSKADNNRVVGKRRIDTLLANLPDGKPGLQVFNTCSLLVASIPSLPIDPSNPEDVDTNSDDHLYDALRYGLVRDGGKPTRVQERPKSWQEWISDPFVKKAGLLIPGLADLRSKDF